MAVCRICRDPRREQIDRALSLPGGSTRGVAGAFGATKSAMARHRLHSVGVVEKVKVARLRTFEDFVASLEELHGKAAGILGKAEKARNLTASTNALREIRQTVELIARLVGELKDGPSVNILLAPEWSSIRAAILEALGPFPEARAAVSAALVRRESAIGVLGPGSGNAHLSEVRSAALPAASAPPINVSAADPSAVQEASPGGVVGGSEA
jgi:hypothetical protein